MVKGFYYITVLLLLLFITLIYGVRYGSINNGFYEQKKEYLNSLINNENFDIDEDLSIDTFEITLSKKKMLQLKRTRSSFIKLNVSNAKLNPYLKAKISHLGDTSKIKIRLKGLMSDHWGKEATQLSYHIKSKDSSVTKFDKFSIYSPDRRNGLEEWLFDELLSHFNLIHQRHNFFNLILNKKYKGLYVMEEKTSEPMLLNCGRKNSIVLSFNKEGFGTFLNSNWGAGIKEAFYQNDFSVKASDSTKAAEAILLLENFRNGKIKASKAFDIEKTSLFLALIEVIGSLHPSNIHNIKFAYNTFTKKIEPIGNDAFIQKKLNNNRLICFTKHNGFPLSWEKLVLKDPILLESYFKHLRQLASNNLIVNFFEKTDQKLDFRIKVLRKYHDNRYNPNYKDIIYSNVKKIKAILDDLNTSPTVSQPLRLEEPLKGVYVTNNSNIPIQLLNVHLKDKIVGRFKNGNIVPHREVGELRSFNFFSFKQTLNPSINNKNLKFSYKYFGNDSIYYIDIDPYIRLNKQSYSNNLRESAGKRKQIILEGNHTIVSNIIFEDVDEVIINPGTILNFRNNSSITSYAPVFFRGKKDNPILITSADSSEYAINVLYTKENSSILNNVVLNLNANCKQVLNFYNSNILINNIEHNLPKQNMIFTFKDSKVSYFPL